MTVGSAQHHPLGFRRQCIAAPDAKLAIIGSCTQLAQVAENRRVRPLSGNVEQRRLGRSADHSRLSKAGLREQDDESESRSKEIGHSGSRVCRLTLTLWRDVPKLDDEHTSPGTVLRYLQQID